MKVFGRWGKDAESTLYNASKMAPLALGMSSTQFLNSWRRHLSVCLQRQNSKIIAEKISCIVGRRPPNPNENQTDIVRGFGVDFLN